MKTRNIIATSAAIAILSISGMGGFVLSANTKSSNTTYQGSTKSSLVLAQSGELSIYPIQKPDAVRKDIFVKPGQWLLPYEIKVSLDLPADAVIQDISNGFVQGYKITHPTFEMDIYRQMEYGSYTYDSYKTIKNSKLLDKIVRYDLNDGTSFYSNDKGMSYSEDLLWCNSSTGKSKICITPDILLKDGGLEGKLIFKLYNSNKDTRAVSDKIIKSMYMKLVPVETLPTSYTQY